MSADPDLPTANDVDTIREALASHPGRPTVPTGWLRTALAGYAEQANALATANEALANSEATATKLEGECRSASN
jgi:hypothetical protein